MNKIDWLKCDFCKSSFESPGGILSEPIPGTVNEHKKQHLCTPCSKKANAVLDLTILGSGTDGIYLSPPIEVGLWRIQIKMLTKEELEKLKSAVQTK